MPEVPLMPIATKMALAIIRVIRVMPLTGLEPTIAIAFAATVVNKKEIAVTTIHATRACQKLCSTPAQKKMSTATRAIAMKNTICFMDISRCQRMVEALPWEEPLISRAARPAACMIMPHDFTMPMIPAIAIPPMPISLA